VEVNLKVKIKKVQYLISIFQLFSLKLSISGEVLKTAQQRDRLKMPFLRLLNCEVYRLLPMLDFCLEHSKIQILKMLDLQKKSAIDSNKL
jgi:hypothetical protein